MKTVIGVCTFGNLDFTKLTIKQIRQTLDPQKDVSICVIVGKDGDGTEEWCEQENITHIPHKYNKGFPAGINDLYDYAFKVLDADAFIAMGNDVIPYEYSLNNLIDVAETTDFEWVCGVEYSVKALCRDWPDARKLFKGPHYIFTDFTARPWEYYTGATKNTALVDGGGLSDVHNLCLYKRSVFDKIGYIDVNFYPAYFEDNDYARRGVLANIKSCTVKHALYFHFWSRTIHQGSGGSTHKFFNLNKTFYQTKWGGDFSQEMFDIPFDGKEYLVGDVKQPNSILIDDRSGEEAIIDYWRNM